MTQKLVITVTDEMHRQLKELAQERGATLAGMGRKILADWLEEQGRPVDWLIEWGGRRRDEEEEAARP